MLPTIPAPAPEQWPAPVVVWQQAGSSGQFNASVDLVRGSARQGAAPSLALVHQPGSNTVFGLGWSLVAPSVMRGNGRQLPCYRDEGPEADAFVVSGIGELVPWLVHEDADWQVERGRDDGELVTRYRPRVESDFARVERRTTRDTGEVYWRTVTRDNVTRHYGRTEGTRIADPADRRRIVQWLLEEEWDSRGNRVRYEYKRENLVGVSPGLLPERHRLAVARPEAMLHPKRVLWGNSDAGGPDDWLFELVFDYGEHDDEAPTREERRPWQLRPDAFSSCRAGFELRTRRRCRRVLLFHNIPELGRPSTLVRAHELTYESTESFSRLVAVTMRSYGSERDGASIVGHLPKVRFAYTDAEPPGPSSEVRDQHGRPAVVDGSAQQWIDLDGSALPGLLVRDSGGALRYRANLGDGRLAEPSPLPSRPALTDAELPLGQAVGQPFGDGRSCLIDLLTGPGYQERAVTDRWRPYTPFPSAPTMRTNATGGRDVDLDGDGRGDLLLLGATGLRWHSFAGRGGWEAGREASAPASALAALADRTGTVLLADMNGDGLADLVEVRPGRIRYWPSLGHGRFGEPVTMAGSPRLEGPDAFDPARVRLVDIDGSGSADLLYLGRSGVVWHPNQAGNSFGSPQTVSGLPPLTDVDAVDVVDLFGSGTGCLVWSSPLPGHARRPLRYVKLTGGARPHQLIRIHNGQGLEVALRYRPSAVLAIEDRRAGRPWFATPPNSMSVLTELRETDLVSGVSHTTRWSYRHGCYDREEREFAGFAFVERRESWDVPPGPAGVPDDLPQPERITRSWQHTGTEDWAELHERLAEKFFTGDPIRPIGPGIVVEDSTGCTPRDLLRSLRGRPVREEIYDASDPTLAVPLAVVENGYLLRGLQPGRGNDRASVLALPRETVERAYEGAADDPRVVQRLALDFDLFGNVLREATLAYPRRAPREPEQNRFLVTFQERDVLNRDEGPWYRLGLPVAERTFELGPLALPAAGGLVRGSELARLLTSGSLAVVPFEHDLPATGPPGRRLLASTQTFYWDDDLAAAAPLGNAGGRALLHHARRAAFTPALLTEVFGQDEPDRRTLEGAGYELDQGMWWASGPVVRYGSSALFQPVSAVTPRGGEHTVVYDTHALLVVETRDPVGNTVRAEPDYRALSATRVIDPNGAVTHTAFDALGLPVALAYGGAHGEGDVLEAPSVVIERDLLAMEREGSPVAVRIAVRTQHGNPASPWERTVAYIDGHGRQIQRKRLAELATEGAVDRWVLEQHAVAGASARVYGPGFTHHDRFSAEQELGSLPVSRILADAMEREIERVRPDGARERKVFAAWYREVWDANDAAIGSDWHIRRRAPGASPLQEAEAVAAGAHADTPTVEHLDPHGRVFLSVEDGASAGPSATRLDLDANGDPRSITDPRQIVTEQRRLDMLGRPLRIRSTASGITRMLLDAEDEPLLAWGARGQKQRWTRDLLGRPLVREVQPAGGVWRVAERLVWGEQEAEVGRYRRDRLFRHYDGAGLMELLEHDFRGNPAITIRRFRKDLDVAADWRPPDGITDPTAIETAARARLADEFFQRNQHHDALGRALSRSIGPGGSTIEWRYGPRGLISGITVSVGGATTEVLRSPTYDAAGRRTGAVLGNGVRESSLYDEGSGFLRRRTTDLPDERPLRDLTLAHDAVGNVLAIEDAAQPRLYFRNAAVGPDRSFRYDALYRLVEARGREAALPPQPPPDRAGEPAPFPLSPGPNDLGAVRAYTQRYAYDRSGNMTRLDHVASGADWTQIFDIDIESDRLVRVRASNGEGASAARYRFDDAGNLLAARMLVADEAEPFVWDEDERLVAVDLGGGGRAVYVYDGAGQRVAKLLLRQGGGREERFSLDGFDVFRRLSGGGELEQEIRTLHVDGGEGRLLLVEQFVRGHAGQGFPPVWRYQHSDQVGSTCLETDQNARPVSFEEFRPFGTAAYPAERSAPTQRKRFRFRGQENDPETGLNLHGVRYYAPWFCRWISPDPGGMLDGTNRYWFTRNNPATFSDPTGFQAQPNFTPAPTPASNYTPAVQPTVVGSGRGGVWQWGLEDPAALMSVPLPTPRRSGGYWTEQGWHDNAPRRVTHEPEQRTAVRNAPRHPRQNQRREAEGSQPEVASSPAPLSAALNQHPDVEFLYAIPGSLPRPPSTSGKPEENLFANISGGISEFWRRGGNHVVWGLVGIAIGLLLLPLLPAVGMAAAGAALTAIAGGFQFGYGLAELSTSGRRSREEEAAVNRRGQSATNMLSFGGSAGAIAAAVVSGGDQRAIEIGADSGAIFEGIAHGASAASQLTLGVLQAARRLPRLMPVGFRFRLATTLDDVLPASGPRPSRNPGPGHWSTSSRNVEPNVNTLSLDRDDLRELRSAGERHLRRLERLTERLTEASRTNSLPAVAGAFDTWTMQFTARHNLPSSDSHALAERLSQVRADPISRSNIDALLDHIPNVRFASAESLFRHPMHGPPGVHAEAAAVAAARRARQVTLPPELERSYPIIVSVLNQTRRHVFQFPRCVMCRMVVRGPDIRLTSGLLRAETSYLPFQIALESSGQDRRAFGWLLGINYLPLVRRRR